MRAPIYSPSASCYSSSSPANGRFRDRRPPISLRQFCAMHTLSARELRTDLPQEIDWIIRRCLEKDPERRMQTAKDVRNELDLARRRLESESASSARRRDARDPGSERSFDCRAAIRESRS
jgi:hypothetical protein